jgi:hypothetical protein
MYEENFFVFFISDRWLLNRTELLLQRTEIKLWLWRVETEVVKKEKRSYGGQRETCDHNEQKQNLTSHDMYRGIF